MQCNHPNKRKKEEGKKKELSKVAVVGAVGELYGFLPYIQASSSLYIVKHQINDKNNKEDSSKNKKKLGFIWGGALGISGLKI